MKKNNVFLLVILMLPALACGLSKPPLDLPVSATVPIIIASATFTPIPTFTSAAPTNPQPTPILSQTVSMQSAPFNESGDAPLYTITAQIPSLQSSTDSRVATLNVRLNQIVQNEISRFKNDVLFGASNPPIAAGSSFDAQYSVIGQRGDIWSIKFDFSLYADGAAHPAHYSSALNYDLSNGREITLAELFLSNSNYLQVISDMCKTELATRDIGFMDGFAQGADPLPENYKNWNLSNEGFLVITFDEYQVASYAAGPQIVTLSFSALQNIVNSQGALSVFVQ